MYREFEVGWEDVLDATPEQVWEALTVHTAAWLWQVDYEPREGGVQSGLGPDATITRWDPPRGLQSVASTPDGWRNALTHELSPVSGGTAVRFQQVSVLQEDVYDVEYEQCVQHTDLYRSTLREYLDHFAGRAARHVEVEVRGSFTEVCGALGIDPAAEVGAPVRLDVGAPGTYDGVIDLRTPVFLGVRTGDALVRVLGRQRWGGATAISLHLFAPAADPAAERRAFEAKLGAIEEAAA